MNNKTSSPANVADKYLTFSLINEIYAIEILKIREIIQMTEITPVPRTPEFVKGVINLRGKVIAVIDLRKKLDLETVEYDSDTCIIITDLREKQIGVIVDRVREVTSFAPENVNATPTFGSNIRTDFIKGIGHQKNDEKEETKDAPVTIILNIDQVLTSEEFVEVVAATNETDK